MYRKELRERKKLLEETIAKINSELPKLPKGNLRIQRNREKPQFFLVTDKSDCHGQFIKSADRELVKELAKKTYYEKVLREAERENRAITVCLKGTENVNPENVYASLNKYRKELIDPLLMSDKDYAKQWEATEYMKNPYRQEECVRETERGEFVRSKVEEAIANTYYALGIPYRYEAPVTLKNGKTKYPDFTLLKLPERIEYYHEHMGCMEDEVYRTSNITKLQEYAESGIFTGKNLILTFETDYSPFNVKKFRNNIKEIFSEQINLF